MAAAGNDEHRHATARPGATHRQLPAAGGLLVAVAGSAGFLVVPMVVTALRTAAVPETWIGLIGSADPMGMLLGAAIGLNRGVRTTPRRTALIALMLAMIANATSLLLAEPAALLALRLGAGMFGGLALAIGLGTLARTRIPDRSFAMLALSQMLFSALVAGIGDGGRGGLTPIYLCLFGLQIIGLAAATLLASRIDIEVGSGARMGRLDRRLILYTGLGNFLSAAGFLMLWANIQLAAARAGLPVGTSVAVLDAGLAGGFAGGIAALLIDGRRRRGIVTALLFTIGLAAILAIALSPPSLPLFLAAIFAFQFSTSTAFFGFGMASEADPGGRLPIIFMLSVKAGFGLAPLIASQLLLRGGIAAVQIASFIATGLALIIYQLMIDRASFARSRLG